MKRTSMKRTSMKRKSMKRKSMMRKSMKRKSMKRKSMKRKSMKRKSMKRKSMKRKSMGKNYGGLVEGPALLLNNSCDTKHPYCKLYKGDKYCRKNNSDFGMFSPPGAADILADCKTEDEILETERTKGIEEAEAKAEAKARIIYKIIEIQKIARKCCMREGSLNEFISPPFPGDLESTSFKELTEFYSRAEPNAKRIITSKIRQYYEIADLEPSDFDMVHLDTYPLCTVGTTGYTRDLIDVYYNVEFHAKPKIILKIKLLAMQCGIVPPADLESRNMEDLIDFYYEVKAKADKINKIKTTYEQAFETPPESLGSRSMEDLQGIFNDIREILREKISLVNSILKKGEGWTMKQEYLKKSIPELKSILPK